MLNTASLGVPGVVSVMIFTAHPISSERDRSDSNALAVRSGMKTHLYRALHEDDYSVSIIA